ncbi:MAG: hypothetical protein BWY32_03837 [bacterium ADurb.Bin243]|nr:MAG: hypothetical protein BWY32_03837 [bacterium ADurb.Bin243]
MEQFKFSFAPAALNTTRAFFCSNTGVIILMARWINLLISVLSRLSFISLEYCMNLVTVSSSLLISSLIISRHSFNSLSLSAFLTPDAPFSKKPPSLIN